MPCRVLKKPPDGRLFHGDSINPKPMVFS